MDSPFPGVDPYIEAQGHWPDFHAAFLADCRNAINERLPNHYAARMEEEIRLVQPERENRIRADVAVLERAGTRRAWAPEEGGIGIATLEPALVPIVLEDPIEVRERWIEVIKLPEWRLVTIVELLSPANKNSPGREDYLAKRRGLLERPVHLVEIDLLLSGRRLPVGRTQTPGDVSAIVFRAGHDLAEVYAWPLPRPLPPIPIPLADPDTDIPIDLASLFADGYRKGLYDRLLRYREPYPLPVDDALRAWIAATAADAR